MSESHFSVRVLWEDVRSVLDLLQRSARASFKPRPVGNHVVIDFALEADARLIEDAFTHCRRVRAKG